MSRHALNALFSFAVTGLCLTAASVKAAEPDAVPLKTISSRVLTPSDKEEFVSLVKNGEEVRIPVVRVEHRVMVAEKRGENRADTREYVQYEIQSKTQEGEPFSWSCWFPLAGKPDRFDITIAEKGKTYATVISGENGLVLVYEVSESNDSAAALGSWDRDSDVLRCHPLSMRNLPGLFQREFTDFLSSEGYTIVIDRLFEEKAELRLTLHGLDKTKQYTLAYREGKWVLVNPPPSLAQASTPKNAAPVAQQHRHLPWVAVAVVIVLGLLAGAWFVYRKKNR